MATTARTSPRGELEEALASRDWQDDDNRWEQLYQAMLFIEDRHDVSTGRLEDENGALFDDAAESVWRLLMSLCEAFNIGSQGDDGQELGGYAVAIRELATIEACLYALLRDSAARKWPVA